MAITSIFSYLETADSFDIHWASVNNSRPTAPLILPDGTTLAMFRTMKTNMNNSFTAVSSSATGNRVAMGALLDARNLLQPRFVQFGGSVRLYLEGTRFEKIAPESPNLLAGREVYEKAGESVAKGWEDINDAGTVGRFVPPLVLRSLEDDTALDYTLGDFEGQLTELLDAFRFDHDAGMDVTQKRSDRNVLLPPIYKAMKDYRATALLELGKTNPLRATIPRLTPPAGTTPPAVTLTGGWDNTLGLAVLNWTKSAAKDLLKLQLRGCTGGTYKTDEEEIIADLLATDTHWQGNWGLTAPGAVVSLKLYVMNTHNNENGGKAFKVVRPSS